MKKLLPFLSFIVAFIWLSSCNVTKQKNSQTDIVSVQKKDSISIHKKESASIHTQQTTTQEIITIDTGISLILTLPKNDSNNIIKIGGISINAPGGSILQFNKNGITKKENTNAKAETQTHTKSEFDSLAKKLQDSLNFRHKETIKNETQTTPFSLWWLLLLIPIGAIYVAIKFYKKKYFPFL